MLRRSFGVEFVDIWSQDIFIVLDIVDLAIYYIAAKADLHNKN